MPHGDMAATVHLAEPGLCTKAKPGFCAPRTDTGHEVCVVARMDSAQRHHTATPGSCHVQVSTRESRCQVTYRRVAHDHDVPTRVGDERAACCLEGNAQVADCGTWHGLRCDTQRRAERTAATQRKEAGAAGTQQGNRKHGAGPTGVGGQQGDWSQGSRVVIAGDARTSARANVQQSTGAHGAAKAHARVAHVHTERAWAHKQRARDGSAVCASHERHGTHAERHGTEWWI